jgi:hypothetical protein
LNTFCAIVGLFSKLFSHKSATVVDFVFTGRP